MKKSVNTEKKNKSSGFNGLSFLLGVLFLTLWQLAVDIYKIQPYILPGPIAVIKALYEERGLLLSHTTATLSEALIGFGIAVVLGVLLGILMGYYSIIRRVFYPMFVISQTIPLIVLTPLFAVWFGFGLLPKVLIIILGCFFPITVTFTQSLLREDEDMDALLNVMGASRWKSFFLVRVPQALPGLFAGLRIAVTYSIMGAVISEWVGAKKGLGIYMTRAMTSFKTAVLFADVLIIVLLSMGLYKLVEIIEKRITKNINY
ncbi:MAG: ABC transporter permease [Acetivibrionales bacterium]|jgi:putative hydroxymethylpyrimidine transport system permease protein